MPRGKKTKIIIDDDDSSVDSKGNIRGLIDYDCDSNDSSDSDVIMAEPGIYLKKVPARKKYKRSAKDKANKLIKETLALSESLKKATISINKKLNDNDAIYVADSDEEMVCNKGKMPSKIIKKEKKKKQELEDDDEDDEEDEYDFDDEEDDGDDEDDYDEDEDEGDEDEDEEEEEEELEEDHDEDEEEEGGKKRKGSAISDALMKMFDDGKTPRRHNMKKEPEIVKNFVKLITSPMEDTNIDTQIDQFKSLPEDKQQQIIKTLQARPAAADVNSSLMFKILDMKLPPEIQSYVLAKYQTLDTMEPGAGEYFKIRNWLEKLSSVPFGQYKEMPVRLSDGQQKCEEFMKCAKEALDSAVFGQAEAKLQILQFIAAKISNPASDGTSLLLVGPAGIGKTSLIKNGISKALGWPFQFISLGGETDASTYTGHQMVYEGSHAGKIVNSIIAAKSMSMVMMFDEIDKISTTPKGEEIQHMLVHLTDPVQNMCFEDKYLANIPIDLSKMMFVFSANDITKIDRILLDRMRVVYLKGYDMAEKINIAQNFLVPEALGQVNLVEKVSFSKEVIQYIIETHAKEEAGVREIRRCIEQIAQKINMLRMFNSKDLAFHIPGFQLPFIIKKEHVDLFIKKKPEEDQSYKAMYI
jgi:ATP-dependent Lon protease